MPKKDAILGYGLLAVALVVCALIGASRNGGPEKITFERIPSPAVAEGDPAKPKLVQVHVSGAVRKPGVYTLKPDSRVHDAIREAGGAKPNAILSEWNLAARVTDGSNLHINSKPLATGGSVKVASTKPRTVRRSIEIAPMRIEIPEEYRGGVDALAPAGKILVTPETKPTTRISSGKKASPAEGSISLNTADSIEFQKLPGIGPSTAEKILAYRQEHGGFTSIDELLAVKGIGPKKLDAIRKYLKL